VKGVKTINLRILLRILFGWLGTPTIACALSVGFTLLVRMIV